MAKTLEERVAFLEETIVKQNDVLCKTNEHLIDLIKNDTDLYQLIDKNDEFYTNIDQVNLVKLYHHFRCYQTQGKQKEAFRLS